MTLQRVCSTCAVAGLVACAHLSAASFIEASHPHQPERRPRVAVEALPPEPDHTHRDFDRSARIQLNAVTVSETSTDAPPFVPRSMDSSDVVLRAWEHQRRHHPAYYGARASVVILPPALLTTGTST